QAASLSLPRARRLLARLQREGLIRQDRSGAGPVQLTDAGLHQAQQMVRAHRLWETYLGDHAGLDAQQVHEEAERLEHAPGLAERLDAVLGRPTRDPHGEQIPPPSSA
ncbi:MAG TPA: iron dependent repressor, metal binding and dimerization domain protein, partial [Phycisphaeraceae bacterium]